MIVTRAGHKYVQFMRHEFHDSVEKPNFLYDGYKSGAFAAVEDERFLRRVRNGELPAGWCIHHKLPLCLGGDNSRENFALIEERPHNYMHQHVIDPQISDMKEGEQRDVELPSGTFYIARLQTYDLFHLEKWNKEYPAVATAAMERRKGGRDAE